MSLDNVKKQMDERRAQRDAAERKRAETVQEKQAQREAELQQADAALREKLQPFFRSAVTKLKDYGFDFGITVDQQKRAIGATFSFKGGPTFTLTTSGKIVNIAYNDPSKKGLEGATPSISLSEGMRFVRSIDDFTGDNLERMLLAASEVGR